MIKNILASVFAFYQLTQGNRLLLQIPGETTTTAPGPPAWVPPEIPTASPQQSMILECLLDNTDPAGCAGRQTIVNNAATNFKMKCSARGACAASEIIFNFENSMAERVEQITFSEDYAGYGATVTIDSTLSAVKQYIDKFECKAFGACMNLNIQLIGGASLNDLDCPYPNNCQNCNVHICDWSVAADGSKTLLCGTPKACFSH